MSLDLFLVAGEASSDLHAAQFLREFKRLHPEVRCFGVGGKALQAEGMEIIVPASQISAFGSTDWLDRASEIVGGYKKTVRTVEKRRPDIAVLLDLPDFNLRIAKKLKALRIPVAYYFSPQVWAWRKYRVKHIQKIINKMLVAFPFEKKFYEENGVNVEFVGHPVLETLEPRAQTRANAEIQNRFRIALLPGSRKSELKRHAPLLVPVIERIKEHYPESEIRLPVANTLSLEEIRGAFKEVSDSLEFVEGEANEVMSWADVALVASGTATLECAVIGTPFALFYKVSALSSFLYQLLVTYKGPIGMPNILLGKVVAKEFFQKKAEPEAIWTELKRLLDDDKARLEMTQSLLECRTILGEKGASQRAALHVHRLLQETLKKQKVSSPPIFTHAPQPV